MIKFSGRNSVWTPDIVQLKGAFVLRTTWKSKMSDLYNPEPVQAPSRVWKGTFRFNCNVFTQWATLLLLKDFKKSSSCFRQDKFYFEKNTIYVKISGFRNKIVRASSSFSPLGRQQGFGEVVFYSTTKPSAELDTAVFAHCS